MIERGRN